MAFEAFQEGLGAGEVEPNPEEEARLRAAISEAKDGFDERVWTARIAGAERAVVKARADLAQFVAENYPALAAEEAVKDLPARDRLQAAFEELEAAESAYAARLRVWHDLHRNLPFAEDGDIPPLPTRGSEDEVAARFANGIEAPTPAFAAGHSMGQYSAFVAADVISIEDGVRLVRERGRLMQASGAGRDGAMAAILGLDDAALPALVARASVHGTFGVANRNAPGQVVVSGERAAIEAAAAIARELGARKAIVLPVSVAAHSPLMAEAAAGMRRVLADVDFHDPQVPLVANADARPILTAAAAREELVEHLTAGVDWVAAVERMAAAGVTAFIEVGPGRVLTGLIKRIAPDVEVIALDDPSSPDRLSVPFSTPATA
jgi:[acyl-carrier-protein] S-malonyltransferase